LAEAAVTSLRGLGVSTEMHYLQGIRNEEVPIWLNASNVLLVTSFHEGSPTIVKEALACDLPVVSVDVGDVRERIKDIDGCYIASDDEVDLAAKLLLVHRGAGKIKGREKLGDVSLGTIARRLEVIYTDVVSDRRMKIGAPVH
jgi:glycosyltransferase involved in cell wall biosynthesis